MQFRVGHLPEEAPLGYTGKGRRHVQQESSDNLALAPRFLGLDSHYCYGVGC